jgi:hypothetical protein
MKLEDLDKWVKSKPQIGDVAYLVDTYFDKRYLYFYKGPDDKPGLHIIDQQFAQDYYIKEINKLKVEDTRVNKRCDNCKYFNGVTMSKITDYWCSHEKYSGTRVAAHTSCPEHEPKKELTTPFDGVRLYLINEHTGEIGIKYICKDCGKEMEKPYHWWLKVPFGNTVPKGVGYHFRCEECDKKKAGKYD